MQALSHDVVEDVLERLPAKALGRFKSVSKQWKSTIESNNFRKRQLTRRKQSGDPDILVYDDYYTENISLQSRGHDILVYDYYYTENISLPFSSSSSSSLSSSVIPIHSPFKKKFNFITTSCDGLVCLYNRDELLVINPTTRWQRTLPSSNYQKYKSRSMVYMPLLGFGKDKMNGTYKPVWLYNNQKKFRFYEDIEEKVITKCEVFDFSTNAWRYVTPPSGNFITYVGPVHVDGYLYWLTKNELATEVLSFDLHTETFQFVATPLVNAPRYYNYKICNMNNRLWLSEVYKPNQVIWSFDSRSKTWNEEYSIDLEMTYSWFRHEIKEKSLDRLYSIQPLAVLKEKKLLFSFYIDMEPGQYFVIYDGQNKSYDLAFTVDYLNDPVTYFQSLISI